MRVFAACVLSIILAAACSDSPVDVEGEAEAILSELGDSDQSPLDSVFGFPNPAGEDPLVVAEQVFFGEVAACMRRQGFAYAVPQIFDPDAGTNADRVGLSEQEFAAEFGFGRSTFFDQRLIELIGPTEDDAGEPDANAELTAAMSEQEAEAWRTALYGPFIELDLSSGLFVDPATGDLVENSPFAGEGCEAEARDRAFGSRAELILELSDELDELESRIASDPAVVSLNQTWSDCMRLDGHTAATPADARADVDERLDDLIAELFEIDFSVHPALWDTSAVTTGNMSDQDRARLDELQQFERGIAVAALACSTDYESRLDAVRSDHEHRFVGENASAIRSALDS